MININVNISTNASENEKKNLFIPYEAIEKFTGNGFAENIYNANVTFSCMPRAINPDLLQICVDITTIVGIADALYKTIKYIFEFVNKCRGYKCYLEFHYKDEHKKVNLFIQVDEKNDAEKMAKEILDKINKLN